MNSNRLIATHVFNIDENQNGGESLILKTDIFHNGDEGKSEEIIFLNQELTLNSYANSASFNLAGTTLTPKKLRELADSIEKAIKMAYNQLK